MAAQSGERKAEAMAASSAYCYSDASSSGGNPNIQTTDIVKQLQSFQSNPEIYNLTAGMEMIGFPSKNLNHHQQITLNNSFLWNNHQSRLLVEDPSLKGSTVFPCDGNERRPSQGLSLSLSSSNPSTIELQSFELRQNDDLRFGPSSSRSVDNIPPMMQGQFYVRNSKYLKPAQELLNEFCNLGTKQSDEISKMKAQKSDSERQWDENAIKLQSLDALELQKTKAKLLQMLDEVDRRYKHYCDQMKGVVSSFEAVAGKGAATVYSAMASKAMSRHFRCLRDAIVNQIKAIQKATGEKDTPIPGATKGETPRLRVLDQKLRQQRAYQQMNMMENHPWRPQRGLPEQSVAVLRAWLFEHFLHPYPSDVDKHILARQTGLSRSQVSNWFINARVRLWKPMVEEMYLEDQKEEEDTTNLGEKGQIPSTHEDRKPTQDQLTNRMDPECLASIINDPGKNNRSVQNDDQHHSFGRVGSTEYGAMQFDFSSYNHHSAPGGSTISYLHENGNFNGGGGGGGGSGVSLTLGLQQHGANGGVSLAFSPASQSSLFYPRSDQIEDCQTGQYSLFDSENQNLQYRNLMGAQLLHDLAG